MAKPSKKPEQTEPPKARWESDPNNILHRLDKAIQLAREHLYGYSDEDIQLIWDIIKRPLSSPDWNCKLHIEDHPPIDRLFDIAIDFNGATGAMIEGEIAPSSICAVYALKTAEYAKTAGDQVLASLYCIDAWRALAFVARAEYLGQKMKSRVENQYNGLDNIHHTQKSKKAQESKKKTAKIRAEFDKLSDYQKSKKEFKEIAELIIVKLGLFTDADMRKFHDKDRPKEDKGIKDTEIENKITSVTKTIKRLQHKEKLEKLSKHSIVDRELQLCWPKRHLDDRDKEQENFSGEIKEFRKGNKTKLDKWVKARAEIIKIQEESKTWDEF
jgi:hypothetical protein